MIYSPTRRKFFATALGGLSATFVASAHVFGQAPTKKDTPSLSKETEPSFAPDTLFLTWQRDPCTTMTVQWLGEEDEIPSTDIHVLPLKQDKDNPVPVQTVKTASRPFPDSNLRVFRAEVTNLKPDTEYQFHIGGVTKNYRFRTMPAKATDAFHFVTGGDCGIGSAAIENNKLVAKQDPYFVLIMGDLGYDNGTSVKTAITFIRNYSTLMIDTQGRLIPLVTGIGNHEVKGSYGKTRKDATFFLPLFDGFYSEKTYGTLDFGDYLSLVLLDTGHVEPIAGEQTDWLEKALRERVDRPHLFVANHVPAYPSYRPPTGLLGKFGTGEQQRKLWCPLFERYDVDVVLEHHDHTFKRTHPLLDGMKNDRGIVYLGDGSWGKLRVPKTPEQRPYLATVNQTYHTTLHRLEADHRFHVGMSSTGKLVDIYSTKKKARTKG